MQLKLEFVQFFRVCTAIGVEQEFIVYAGEIFTTSTKMPHTIEKKARDILILSSRIEHHETVLFLVLWLVTTNINASKLHLSIISRNFQFIKGDIQVANFVKLTLF